MNENVKKSLIIAGVVLALGVAAFSANRAFRGEQPVDVATIDAGPNAMSEKDRSMQNQGAVEGKEVDLSGG